MATYHVFWLVLIALSFLSAVAVVGLGCWLLRKPVEDLSNSTTFASYLLRIFRYLPGAAIVVFGSILLWRLVTQILLLKLPT